MKGSGGSAWPTVQARDIRSGDNPDSPRQARKIEQGWSQNLNDVAEADNWQTPRTVAGEYTRDKGQKGAERLTLEGQGAMWQTPASDSFRSRGGDSKEEMGLDQQARATWPTPASRDHKGSSEASVTRVNGKTRLDLLDHRAEQGFSHPAPETVTLGPTLSQLRPIWGPLRASVIASHGRATWRRLWKGRGKRRLNPTFVEWLMGWPPGHALCDCSEMEFTRWQQDMRSALSQLPTASGQWIWKPPSEVEAMQMDLF